MKILIAEDNSFYRMMLEATLVEWGYEVQSVSDGAAAWEVLREPNAPKLAILDWVMPVMDGTEVCAKVREINNPEPTYLIILTAREGKENIVTALDCGADDYLTKPFDREELQARLKVGLRIVGLQTSQAVVFAFAQAVEAKSPYTRGHTERVTKYALDLADHIGVRGADRELLRKGSLLHDIGKISMPDAILNKPGRLTPDEFDVVKQHPLNGVQIVEPLQTLRDAIPLIRWHHERLDGRGYPDGLSGEAIPFLVRILSVADVYDALASERPYRVALPLQECLDMLRADASGGALDAHLVEQFCRMLGGSGCKDRPLPPAVTAVESAVERRSASAGDRAGYDPGLPIGGEVAVHCVS